MRQPWLKALNSYSVAAATFGIAENEIAKIMGIEFLSDPTCWPELWMEVHSVFKIHSRLRELKTFLPKVLQLIEQENVEVMKHDPSKAPPELQGKALLTVIVLEEKNSFSRPKRIIETLEAVELLYDSVAILNGEKVEQQMVLLACDSGSDKSFDLLGVAKLVDAVKEIILSLSGC